MKITKKNNKYHFELSEFEAKILFLVAGSIRGNGRARKVFSDSNDSIVEQLSKYPEFDEIGFYWEIPNVKLDGFLSLFGNGPIEPVKKVSLRDNNGKFLTTKKNVYFNYPVSSLRHCHPPYGKFEVERRKILNFKKENGYLTGIDSKDNKFKRFDLNKVSNIRYF
jgi:hypothetical protein